MTPAALLVLAQKGFLAHLLGPLFCGEPAGPPRHDCLESLRPSRPCGCR